MFFVELMYGKHSDEKLRDVRNLHMLHVYFSGYCFSLEEDGMILRLHKESSRVKEANCHFASKFLDHLNEYLTFLRVSFITMTIKPPCQENKENTILIYRDGKREFVPKMTEVSNTDEVVRLSLEKIISYVCFHAAL